MRIRIRHETAYAYGRPPHFMIQTLRLTPRSSEGQSVRRWRIGLSTDCRLARDEDCHGNILHTFSLDGPIERLAVTIEGEIDTVDTAGLVRGCAERFQPPFYLRSTALTQADEAIRDFARDLARPAGDDRIAALHALNSGLHAAMTFDAGASSVETSAGEAFAAKRGVCQDFAQVLVAACRSEGIPARYVGGYFLRTDTEEQEAGHAWAEAYAEGLGWIALDPVHGLSATERYVRVAAGLDSLDAAPVRGAVAGGGEEALSVRVHVSARPGAGAG